MQFTSYSNKKIDDVFTDISSGRGGLSSSEAEERLKKYGANAISSKKAGWWSIALRQFNSPFIYLLFFSIAVSLRMGDRVDGLIIFAFVLINASLGFIQEYHSENSLSKLNQFIKSSVKAKRDGKEILLSADELVPGDVVVIETGDVIPADIRFFQTSNLIVNEEVLTGESAPVSKNSEIISNPNPQIYEALNMGFSGTAVSEGVGTGVVIGTGKNTVMGDIAGLASETKRESGFEKGIFRFSRFIFRMIIVIMIFLFLANVSIKGVAADIGELILFSLALAISVVPEALPVITTISLSRGALSLARNNVVVRRLSAVEDLGSIEVLCTDKTGTLTENKLTVANINALDKKKCLEYAALTSAFLDQKKREPNNAFDLAVLEKLSSAEREDLNAYEYLSEAPFDPEKKINSVLLRKGGECALIVRGAPEIVLNLCRNLDGEERKKLKQWAADEGMAGKRVIAVASKACKISGDRMNEDEKNSDFIGLISFTDPIKSTAKEAIFKAEQLKVQVKILTGDSAEVAYVVGKEVGVLKNQTELITGDDFDNIPEEEKLAAVKKYHVFARVSPRQKYRIIELLQHSYIVGFLGEGINDSPALKLANVALVVNSAAPIARDAADIVLLNSSLLVIIDGIREGREIFANIVKYLKITLISNFGNFYAVATASLVLPYLPMLPIQILLLNLLSDFPMIAISTDTVDISELRNPRTYEVREVIRMALIFGLISTVFDFIVFALFYQKIPAELQTNWFIASVLTELVLIYSIRTKLSFARGTRPSGILSGLCIASFALTVALPFSHFGQSLFKFIRPSGVDMAIIFSIVVSYFFITEISKFVYYRFFNHHPVVAH